MIQLNRLKTAVVNMVTFVSVLTIAMGSTFAQETQKPSTQTEQKTEQTNGCGCCKKMMENTMKDMKDRTNTMPGMNHPTSPIK